MIGYTGAIFGETALLRVADWAPVYSAIIGIETLIIMLVAWLVGEAISLRQISGTTAVILGLMLVKT